MSNKLLLRNTLTQKEVRERLNDINTALNFILGGLMDVTDSYMLDTTESMKKHGIYRREIKRKVNVARESMQAILRVFREYTNGCPEMYLDLLDLIQDGVKKDVTMLYYPIKNIYDKHKDADTDLKADMMLVYLLQYIACMIFDTMMQEVVKVTGIHNSAAICNHLDPHTPIKRWAEAIALTHSALGSEPRWDEILNDKTIGLGMTAIGLKMCDSNYINGISNEVLQMHPEAVADYNARHPNDKVEPHKNEEE